MQTLGRITWVQVIYGFVCTTRKGLIHQHQEVIYSYKAPFMKGAVNVQDLVQSTRSTESHSAVGLL